MTEFCSALYHFKESVTQKFSHADYKLTEKK